MNTLAGHHLTSKDFFKVEHKGFQVIFFIHNSSFVENRVLNRTNIQKKKKHLGTKRP